MDNVENSGITAWSNAIFFSRQRGGTYLIKKEKTNLHDNLHSILVKRMPLSFFNFLNLIQRKLQQKIMSIFMASSTGAVVSPP